MLPQETSVRQLKMLRALTKGKDIGDLTKDDRLNHNIPNIQYIGNPVDTGIESWQEFCQKDSSLQTIAFKSKLVNKPIVKENKTENMKDIKKFENFEEVETTHSNIRNYFKNIWSKDNTVKNVVLKSDLSQYSKYLNPSFDWNSMTDDELQDLWMDWENEDEKLAEIGESIKTFEDFEWTEGEEQEELKRLGKKDEDEEQEFFERPLEDDDDEDNTRPPFRTGFEMNDDEDSNKIDFLSDFDKRETDSLFGKKEISTDRQDIIDLIYNGSRFKREELEHMDDEELAQLLHDLKLDLDEGDDLDENIKTFEDFGFGKPKVIKSIFTKYSRDEVIDIISKNSTFNKNKLENMSDTDLDDLYYDLELLIRSKSESIKTFEAFSVPAAKKEEKQPEYTVLGEEKELKSDPNFGYAAVRAQEIKKISDFNLIDPPIPKERTIGGNAGVFIDNDKVKGYLNRIEGKDAYVESLDEPMVIKKFNLKDVVKTKKSE